MIAVPESVRIALTDVFSETGLVSRYNRPMVARAMIALDHQEAARFIREMDVVQYTDLVDEVLAEQEEPINA